MKKKPVYFLVTNGYMYEYKDGRVVRKELKKEDGIYTSIIYFKDVFNQTLKIPADVSEDELLIQAEEKLYNESTLDLSKEYKINYKIQKLEDYYLVDAFVVDVEKLERKFAPLLKIFEYIDFISAAPFVFKQYYEINDISPKVDLFIYFTPEDAFAVGFKDKEFVFVKNLDKFSTLAAQTKLSKEELIKILEEKGLDKSLYEENDEMYSILEGFFSQFFMRVNNLINYAENFYRLEKIERIFFYSNIKIKNLIDNYENFWRLSGIEFKKFKIDTTYDAFEYCATLYNANNYSNEDENFSVFLRPPKFYKTESGKLIIFSTLLFLLVGGDALYRFYIINYQERIISELKHLLQRREQKLKSINFQIKNYKEKIKEEKENILNINKQLNDITAKIDYLYNLKLKEPLYNEIADIINFLIENDLILVDFKKDKSSYIIKIRSYTRNSNLIAKFINYLISLGYHNVSSKGIINEKDNYVTEIRFYRE